MTIDPKYRKDRALTLAEYQELEVGDIVYCTYKEHGESKFRVDGPYEIQRIFPDGGVFLDDGTIGAVTFNPHPDHPNHVYDNCYGDGDAYLYTVHEETPEDLERDAKIQELERRIAELERG